jgi:hypothetical protein
VNLVLSIWLVQVIGLAGIYVGTVISGLIANVTKPFIIYRACFDRKASGYFIDSVKYLAVVVLCTGLCQVIANHVIANLSIGTFLLMVILITLIYNGIFLVLFGRSGEAQYLFGLVRQRLKKG